MFRSRSSHSPSDTTVCITGISGYVSGHITKILLSEGYKVRGTVRSLANKNRLSALYDLQKQFPGGSLSLHEADLTKDGSFDEAVKGVQLLD
jgi:GDP-D-mannose dehydratase